MPLLCISNEQSAKKLVKLHIKCKIYIKHLHGGVLAFTEDVTNKPVREKTNNLGSNTNQPVQSQKQARSLKFRI